MGEEMSVHLGIEELEAGLKTIREAPKDEGRVERIARRPAIGEREGLEDAELDVEQGLVGDNWCRRPKAHPDRQLTLMGSRAAALIARVPERWALAGDQLFVDLDLSDDNLPAGTRLAIGSAIVEVTAAPHTGCKKFVQRFGLDAMKFVNSPEGRRLNLRGVNAKVVRSGTVRRGELARKLPTR